MALNDFATIALATAAGYKYTSTTQADGNVKVTLSKPVVGFSGQSGSELKAEGLAAAASAAGTIALTVLNAGRSERYGFQASSLDKSPVDGTAATLDVT